VSALVRAGTCVGEVRALVHHAKPETILRYHTRVLPLPRPGMPPTQWPQPAFMVAVHTLESLKSRGFGAAGICKTAVLRLSGSLEPLVFQRSDL
jgi:hypothetical protein